MDLEVDNGACIARWVSGFFLSQQTVAVAGELAATVAVAAIGVAAAAAMALSAPAAEAAAASMNGGFRALES